MGKSAQPAAALSRTSVQFPSNGDILRGWLYMPDRPKANVPCIVLSHGFSAVKEQYLDRYCEAFAAAGFAALAFDHACFGESDGVPRQEVDPERQITGIQDAISFAQSLPAIDAARIGLWGSSYSGGHALSVAARDQRVAAVVVQVPTISGSRAAARRPSSVPRAELEDKFNADLETRRGKGTPEMIPVTSQAGEGFFALPGYSSYQFFETSKSFAPTWQNRVTLQSVRMAREYEPGENIERIAPRPLLMIVVDDDHLTPADLAVEAFDRLDGTKELHVLRGGHFDPYVALFDETSMLALRWFDRHLR